MSDCTHDCSSCGESCAERQGGSPFQIKPLREGCRVGKVYGVVSGKGGGACHVQGNGRFAYRGTGGENYLVTVLPAARQTVEVGKSGRYPRDAILVGSNADFYLPDGIFHKLHHGTEMFGIAAFFLQPVEQGMGVCQRIIYVG